MFARGVGSEVLTDLLGLDAAELREQLHDGATLAEIAEAQGVDPRAVVDALVDELEERVATAVENGRLDQAEADEQPDEGEVRFGRDVRIATLEQDPQLPPGTVAEFLGDSWQVAAVATSLGIQPLLGRRTDELSGGQAKRAALAKALVGEFDLIMLDEPTNHLDLEAIEWLEERLAAPPRRS
jgi:ABC-type dipeptide/oligopeptide/nickel transport system ATPase subunit